jgi:hypothetical protein
VEIGTASDGGEYTFDRRSLATLDFQGQTVTSAWVREIFPAPQSLVGGGSYSEILQLMYFDCSGRRSTIAQLMWIESPSSGTVLRRADVGGADVPSLAAVVPQTVSEMILEAVCRARRR